MQINTERSKVNRLSPKAFTAGVHIVGNIIGWGVRPWSKSMLTNISASPLEAVSDSNNWHGIK